ncbi:MAG: hypothetical protein ACK55I_07000, partial [bacterium]
GFSGCSRTDRDGKIYQKSTISCNMLASPQRLDRSRVAHQSLGEVDQDHGSAKAAGLVAGNG